MSHCISSILLPYNYTAWYSEGCGFTGPHPGSAGAGDDGCSSTGGDGGECTLYHGKQISVIAS